MSKWLRKPSPKAVLKNLPFEVQEAIFERTDPPGGGQSVGFKELVAWLKTEHNVETSTNALSKWRDWWIRRQERKDADESISDILAEEKQMHPELTDDQLNAKGQRLFTLLAIARQDLGAWSKARRVQIAEENKQIAREQFIESTKTEREKALDALALEIKGLPEAEAAFAAFKATLPKEST